MDFPIATISMGLSILYFKGSQDKISKLICIFVSENYSFLASALSSVSTFLVKASACVLNLLNKIPCLFNFC